MLKLISKSLHPFSQMARVYGEHSQRIRTARHCHEKSDLLTINCLTFLTFFKSLKTLLSQPKIPPKYYSSQSYCYCNKTQVTWYYLKSLLEHVGSLCSHCVNAPGQLFSSHANTPPIYWKGKRLKCQKLCAISITYVSSTIKTDSNA